MRPNAIEAIRGIQAALAEEIAPEVKSEYGQSVLQTLQMLLESLARGWDTDAEQLRRDNRVLRELLARSAAVINGLPKAHNQFASVAAAIERILGIPQTDSLLISEMSAENAELRGVLEQLMVGLEDMMDDPAYSDLRPIRKAGYDHLREVAVRGWSVWDALSFRERMARERTA